MLEHTKVFLQGILKIRFHLKFINSFNTSIYGKALVSKHGFFNRCIIFKVCKDLRETEEITAASLTEKLLELGLPIKTFSFTRRKALAESCQKASLDVFHRIQLCSQRS